MSLLESKLDTVFRFSEPFLHRIGIVRQTPDTMPEKTADRRSVYIDSLKKIRQLRITIRIEVVADVVAARSHKSIALSKLF